MACNLCFFCNFSRKDFGVIIGTEKDDSFKVYPLISSLSGYYPLISVYVLCPGHEGGVRRTNHSERSSS